MMGSKLATATVWAALLLTLGSGHSGAMANSPANQGPRPQLEPGQFINTGLAVAAMVDEYQIGELWDRSSPTMKQVIGRDKFISQTSKALANCGVSSQRSWVSINYMEVAADQPQLPAGEYVSVKLQSDCSSGGQMFETVTYHRASSKPPWAVIGYIPQREAA